MTFTDADLDRLEELPIKAPVSVPPPCGPYVRMQAADRNTLIAEVRRLRAEATWRPIGDAPRDGTWLIVSRWNAEGVRFTRMFWACRAQWTEQWSSPRWWDGVEPCGLAGPTHFLSPLPPPPERET